MDRRRARRTLLGAVAAWPCTAAAQPAEKVYRLGVLRTEARSSAPHLLSALEDGLRDRGCPGGNVTGVSVEITPEIVGKQLQLLTEVAGGIRRVAVLANPPGPVRLRRPADVLAAQPDRRAGRPEPSAVHLPVPGKAPTQER
jgi:hypothetical protein